MAMRKTNATKAVAEFFSNYTEPVWGLEVCRKLDLLPGTVYPILQRMEAAGWLTSSWGDITDKTTGPRRRNYAKTAQGRIEIATYLADDTLSRDELPSKPVTEIN